MFLNSIQLEISSFIRTKIGNYIYAIQFGHVGEVDLRLEYKNTLPNRNEAFIITKGISDVEKKMREKYNYILIDIMEFLQVTNQFYDNRDFNAIKDIIMEDDNIIIEIGESLCPSIIYSTKHEYRAVFAPYLIELREELESYKEFYNANKEKLAIST